MYILVILVMLTRKATKHQYIKLHTAAISWAVNRHFFQVILIAIHTDYLHILGTAFTF